ncbi:MAG: DUF1566 domain-containing protein [Bacteroidales bacterium]|nr:DUF1566 domain-containing protein [Bacteroidales bacterium]
MLSSPMVIRFLTKNDTVTDTKTGLMWAAHDNGKDINWANVKTYCENYKGGGFSDWRLPTIAELKGLYQAGIRYKKGDIINITERRAWASKTTRNSKGTNYYANFSFRYGKGFLSALINLSSRRASCNYRALPVRSGK